MSNLFCKGCLIRTMFGDFAVGLIECLQLVLGLFSFLFCHSVRQNTENKAETLNTGQSLSYSSSTHFSLCLFSIICVALSASAICSFLVTISSTDTYNIKQWYIKHYMYDTSICLCDYPTRNSQALELF